MIKTKQVQILEEELESVICDVCKKEFINTFDIQEFLHINFVGGYTSVFGDCVTVKCDICQNCLKNMIKNYMNCE